MLDEYPARMVVAKTFLLFLFLVYPRISFYVLAQVPDDTDLSWRGNMRAIAVEELQPKSSHLHWKWTRGWICGWTRQGLCFSPYHRNDINDFYIIPFKNLGMDLYCDQVPDPFQVMIFSSVLVEFKQKPGVISEGRVMTTTTSYNLWTGKATPKEVEVETKFKEMRQAFHPSQVKLKRAHNACKYFKTDCKPNERCVPRSLFNHIWPGAYRCECKSGYQDIRGRGCVDEDECKKSPCESNVECVNTPGNYTCQCQTGYRGKNCEIEIDECQIRPCPEKSICKNTPGSYTCTCLPGYEGDYCTKVISLVKEPRKGTASPVEEKIVKRITIPVRRKTRKILTTSAAGLQQSLLAVMCVIILLLDGFGIFLYRWRKKNKQSENQTETSTNSLGDKKLRDSTTEASQLQIMDEDETVIYSLGDEKLRDSTIEPSQLEMMSEDETVIYSLGDKKLRDSTTELNEDEQ